MFGGLSVKTPEKKKEEASQPAPAPAVASAFSFMTSAAAPAPAPEPAAAASAAAPPPSSGFSFLNRTSSQDSGTHEPKQPSAGAPAAPETTSAFSFLAASSKDEGDAGGASAPAAAAEPPAAATPSFGFLQSKAATSAVPDLAATTKDSNVIPSPDAGTTGFNFLSTSDTVSTMSRDSPAPSETSAPHDFLSTTTPQQQQPAGSGVVFGGAMAAASKKPKKKRTRASKVGVATGAGVAPVMPPRPPLPNVIDNNPEPPEQLTRDKAVEATQRAQEFMEEKMRETTPSTEDAPSSFAPVREVNSTDSDDILAAAKAAAEEAQHMAKHKGGFGDRIGLGGLFRRNASPPSNSPQPSAHKTPALPNTSSAETKTLTPLERLQKEQEEVKRAMDQRQLEMMQHQRSDDAGSASIELPKLSSATSAPISLPSYGPPKNLISVVPVPQPPSYSSSAPVQQVAVPKPKSPTDVFHDMMKDFCYQVTKSMEKVSQLRQQRSMLLDERFVAVAKERLATQEKAQAEAQQMAAAESEDFELADRMGTVIESHERERAELAVILENIGRALQQLDAQKKEVVQGVTDCFREFQKKLKSFQEEQESRDTQDATEALRKFATVSKQLSAENERLEQDLKHLEKDAAAVADERKELEKVISEQAGEFERLRDEAREKLKTVEEEIEELRQKLAAKQAVAAELRTEAAGHDEAVLRVRVKFSRQLTRVQKKETTIEDNREEWELEKRSFEAQKQQHEAEVSAHSEALLARDQLLESLHREVEMADTFEAIVSKEIGFEGTTDEESESDDDLVQLQAEVVKSEAAVNEAKEYLEVTTSALKNMQDEIKGLEFRIPQLEEIKKAAAARRDFKAAGKASKEIKEATARLKECEEELVSAASEKKNAAEMDLQKLEAVLEEKRKAANEKEKLSGVASMQRLADNIKRLVATKESVCGEAADNTIQGVGAYILDAQIKSLKLEGQAYGDKYGGWAELMAEIGVDAATETADAAPIDADGVGSTEPDEPTEVCETKKEQPSLADGPGAVETVSQEAKEAKMAKFRQLTKRLKDVEDTLEAAVANEEFDEAAELDEVLQELMAELTALDLTDEEMDAALAEAPTEIETSSQDKTEDEKSAPAEEDDTKDELPREEEEPQEDVETADTPPETATEEANAQGDIAGDYIESEPATEEDTSAPQENGAAEDEPAAEEDPSAPQKNGAAEKLVDNAVSYDEDDSPIVDTPQENGQASDDDL